MNPFATAALLAIAIAQLSMAYMAILDRLVLSGSFTEFLTWPAYKKLIEQTQTRR